MRYLLPGDRQVFRARFRVFVLAVFVAAWVASCRGAPYPDDLWLQHVPTLLGLIVVVWTAAKCCWSTLAFSLAIAFLALHVVAARYCYGAVPYDDWVRVLFGASPQATLGLTRNHFDRLVHFCYGFLITLPVCETLRCGLRLGRGASLFFAIEFIVASSALYEIVEWVVAVVMAPETADRFNGQQGDFWDAQKDMALALAGALVAIVVIAIRDELARPTKDTRVISCRYARGRRAIS